MKNFILAIVLLLVSMTAFSQGIPLSTNFTVNTGLPIDDRMSMPNTAARDAIPALRRWQGMLIYVVDIGKHFTLIGGIDNANWTELSGSGGGIAEFQPTTEYKEKDVVFEANRIYYANADFTSGASFNPSDWTELSPVDLTLASGQLPVANGTNFVNKTTAETVAGDKTFTGETTFSNRVTMTDMINIDRPAGIVKTDSSGNIEVGTVDLTDEVVGSLPQNNGGNGNLIPTNASFELSPVNTGWTCSAIVPSASGAASVDGAQGITFTASSASQGCTRYVTMPEGNVGKLLEYSMYVKSTGGDVEVCSINDSIVSNCKTYTVGQSTDVVKVIVTDRPKNANTNANGILFRTKTATSTTFFGDLAYIGLPKSDEAIVAKFDNTTNSVPCTFSTLAWQGLGTVTNNLKCERAGSRLLINGSLNAGTVAAAIAQMPLPTNFGSITIAPTGVAGHIHVGTYGRGAVDVNHGGIILIRPDLSNLIEFSSAGTFGNPSSASLAPSNGNSMVVSSERFSFSASIPIAEWSSQTNAAIVACKEGPFKCYDDFTTQITTTSGVIDSTKNTPVIAPWFTSCTAANPTVCTINPAFNLTNPLSCDADYLGSGGGQAYIAQVVGSTTTQVSIVTFASTNGANVASLKFKLSCSKVDGDRRNPNTTVTPMSDMNDVKSTEWVVGYDHIDNKPIYKKCNSNFTFTDGANILTGVTRVVSFTGFVNTSGTDYYLLPFTNGANLGAVYFQSGTSSLKVSSAGAFAGKSSYFCAEYVK